MRPIPHQKHYRAVLIIVAIVAANAAIASLEPALSDPQANLLCEAYKTLDPSALPNDTVFGPSGPGALWRLHMPAWQRLLASAVGFCGRFFPDAAMPTPQAATLLLASVTTLLYLLSMYWLLYRQTHVWSISVAVAILSTAMFSSRRPSWGIGPIFAVGPEFLYLALVPLIVLLLVRWRNFYFSAAAFFLAGLWGNFDIVSAINLLLVILIAFLGARRFRPRALLQGLIGLLLAAAGLLPAILHLILTYRSAFTHLVKMPLGELRDALLAGGCNLLYPGLLSDLLRFLSLAAIIGIPSAIILVHRGRYRVRDLPFWTWMLISVLFVSLALQAAVQLVAYFTGRTPFWLEFFPSLPLAMLPLWILFAQAMASLIRLSRTHRHWTRLALASFAIVFMASSYNLAPLRHRMEIALGTPSGERLLAAASDKAEIQAIARWAAKDTEPQSLFLTTEAELRYIGHRSMLASPPDVLYFFHLRPQDLTDFSDVLDDQNDLLHPPEGSHVEPALLARRADELQKGLRVRAKVYAVVAASLAPPPDERLRPIEDPAGQWGKNWRVFEIQPRPKS